jgi:hypothetical protein
MLFSYQIIIINNYTLLARHPNIATVVEICAGSLRMDNFKLPCLVVTLLLLTGCKITQVVPEGGTIVSRTGETDCAANQTCEIDVVNGAEFSDTFTAVADHGYRFAGWKQADGYLCGGSAEPCALENVSGELTSLDVEVYLEPIFEPDLLVSRTPDQITLVESRTVSLNSNTSWELNFYRNEAYTCGLSGNYTFFVMEPANNPGAESPLWAYLHGGGYGWFDEDEVYQTVKNLTQDTWNHEESFDDLINKHLVGNTMRNDEVMDSTLTRRIQEGYRVLLVSLCDHDNYAGRGTPYPNNPNPNGGERQVNGLQATMAAVDYTVANYPTTHVFAHGTSAGSLGAFAMSQAYAEEGTYLTAIVADSWAFTPPRIFDMFDALVGQPGYVFNGGDLRTDGMDKLGFPYEALGVYPEAVIEGGFVEVPSMFIIGEKDPGCGGYRNGILQAIPQAAAAGLSNCGWQYDDLRDAIANQPDSPHVFDLSPTADHVETNRQNPVNNRVDNFISGVLATDPPYPVFLSPGS